MKTQAVGCIDRGRGRNVKANRSKTESAGAGDGQRTVVVCPERIVATGVRVGEHSGIKRGGRIYRAVRGGPRRLRPAACSDGVMGLA